jgi:hypothetical protein
MMTCCRATTIFSLMLLLSTTIDHFSEITSWGILVIKLWGNFGVYYWFGFFWFMRGIVRPCLNEVELLFYQYCSQVANWAAIS